MTTLMKHLRSLAALVMALSLGHAAAQNAAEKATNWPAPHEGDFVIQNFRFASGEAIPDVRMHYTTLGTPAKDAAGHTTNAVLILHGTGGSGRQFLRPMFAG